MGNDNRDACGSKEEKEEQKRKREEDPGNSQGEDKRTKVSIPNSSISALDALLQEKLNELANPNQTLEVDACHDPNQSKDKLSSSKSSEKKTNSASKSRSRSNGDRDREFDELKAMVLQMNSNIQALANRNVSGPEQTRQSAMSDRVNEGASTSYAQNQNLPTQQYSRPDPPLPNTQHQMTQGSPDQGHQDDSFRQGFAWQDAVNAHYSNFLVPPPASPHPAVGAGVQNLQNRPSEYVANHDIATPFYTNSLSSAIQVSEDLKKKIQAGDWVDLSDLIDTKANTPAWSRSQGGQPEPQEDKTKDKKDLTSKEWTKAFLIYMHVYTAKFKDEASAMMEYMHLILELMDDNAGWKFYDRKFREERASQTNKMPWSTFHHMWYAKSQNKKNDQPLWTQPRNNGAKKVSPNGIPGSYCWRFHTNGTCNQAKGSCNFSHLCPTCGARHSRTVHYKLGGRQDRTYGRQDQQKPYPRSPRQRRPPYAH